MPLNRVDYEPKRKRYRNSIGTKNILRQIENVRDEIEWRVAQKKKQNNRSNRYLEYLD